MQTKSAPKSETIRTGDIEGVRKGKKEKIDEIPHEDDPHTIYRMEDS